MVYKQDIYKTPFWAESGGYITGRDPLGIQNSSIATYSRLLPGMTNLTLRIRYYGFYLWLLSEYHAKKKNEENNLWHHYNFIRRAELIIAFLMMNKFPDEQSIVGINYAIEFKESIDQLGYYDIAHGADKGEANKDTRVYWDYNSGALGQYYAGALSNLQLITTNSGYFIIQEKGIKLADAYKSSIPEKTRKVFISIIEKGRLSRSEIDQIISFAINNISSGSKEWEEYTKIIFNNDGNDFIQADGTVPLQRVETIKYFLNFLHAQNRSHQDFPEYQYKLNHNTIQKGASFGWYFFYLNEVLHFSLESIFWGLLTELELKDVTINEFVEGIVEKVIPLFLDEKKIEVTNKVSDLIEAYRSKDLRVEPVFKELEQLHKSQNQSLNAISYGFKTILIAFIENERFLEELNLYLRNNYLFDKKGRVTEVFKLYILEKLNLSIKEYLSSCIRMLLNDHMVTAYRKMGNRESNLLKFTIEYNRIIHIQTMVPKFTSPRLKTLFNFLRDLHYINSDGSLTWNGENLRIELN